MNQTLSLRPTQTERALVLLAALGFSALVGLAALEPAVDPGPPATATAPSGVAVQRDLDPALRTVEPGVLPASAADHEQRASSPRFERSNEPAIDFDALNAHGG